MATRWQISVWVLAGLILIVAALWDNATMTAVADRMTERTEAVDGSDRSAVDEVAPSDLAFGDLDGTGGITGSADGGGNLLRPTTTTTTRPTTTSSTTTVPDEAPGTGSGSGEQAPGSATTTPIDGESPGTTGPGGPSSTAATGSSTTEGPDPALITVYDEDFAEGSLVDGRWSVADSTGFGGRGLLRPSAVMVVPDTSALGGHVLAITARQGSGADADQVVSGAVRLLGHPLTHGRYTIRARVDADTAGATAGVVLLRPVDARDPSSVPAAEIRIMETAWRVYTLDWTADRVVVAVDGEPLVLTTDPSRVPTGAMDLAIRLDPVDTPTAPGEQPTLPGPVEVRLLIDWIHIERVAGGASS